MDHSRNGLFDGNCSSAHLDKGRLSALYFMADVIGTLSDRKDAFVDVGIVKCRLRSLLGKKYALYCRSGMKNRGLRFAGTWRASHD